MKTKNIKISELPETTTKDGVKVYGTTSYETQIAILSHYLHSLDNKHDIESSEQRYEILAAIRDYIEYKRQHDKKNLKWENLSEEEITMESTLLEDLGADSIELVDLIMSVEEEYDIEVPDDAADEIRTVGDAVRFIENLVD